MSILEFIYKTIVFLFIGFVVIGTVCTIWDVKKLEEINSKLIEENKDLKEKLKKKGRKKNEKK